MTAEKTDRFAEHRNAFGFLRLFFASLVIASHIPEIVDGDSHRELLHRLTGTITLGWLAVAGFFLISGYLITKSLLSSPNLFDYFRKRIARIYPAFVVASIICLTIVAPLAGAGLSHGLPRAVAAGVARMLILARPAAQHPFEASHFHDSYGALDGAVWSIQYEFACYLLIAVLLVARLLKGSVIVALSVGLLSVGIALPDGHLLWLSHQALFPGPPVWLSQLSGLFLAGAAWYFYRDRVRFSKPALCVAAAALVVSLCVAPLLYYGLALFGGYLVFGIAKLGGGSWLERINNRTDLSYGVYIYAWPIEQLLIRYSGLSSLVALGLLTWLAALVCGWISWTVVERPILQLLRSRSQQVTTRPAVAATTS